MSIMSSVSNIFRPTQQVSVTGQPTTPGHTMQPNNPGAAPQSAQGGNQSQPQGDPSQGGNQAQPPQEGGNSPLDGWKDIWQNDPNIKPAADPWVHPLLPTDPTKVREAANKMDLVAGIPQELMARVQAGNDPAALVEMINQVARNTLAVSAQLTAASVEHAGTAIRDRTRAELPGTFKKLQLDTLPVDNPVLSHPGAQGMLQLARQQLQMKHPDWSAQQIQEAASKYLLDFATAASAANQPTKPALDSSGTPEQDWSNFLQ